MSWFKLASATELVTLKAKLKRTPDGYHYLSVPEGIVKGFLPLLPDGVVHPGHKWKKYVGAHISVTDPEECPEGGMDEVGDEFEYEINGLREVETPRGDTVYMIEVSSPALEKLRESYGLTPKMKKDHEFHITVGVTK